MKKKLVALFSIFFMFILCAPLSVSAANKDNLIENINEIYLEAYEEAVNADISSIASDEDAYAYIVSNIQRVTRNSDGTIILNTQGLQLNDSEMNTIMSFISKINILVELQAITVDQNLQLHFAENPESISLTRRIPTASIMTEARNHAAELRTVYDNAVFTEKNYTAGIYFAERVKSGGAWDYKSYMGTSTLYYMEDLKVNMDGETIGNFHYGYVGRAVWPASILKSAAGMYQIISGTSTWGYWDSFFDDPADQEDIEWGISVYESEH